jgi:hypothetical protein
MKGYRNTFKAGFEKGLRVEDVSNRNSGLLIESMGARVMGKIYEGYSPNLLNLMSDELALSFAKSWPFPQVFLTDVGIFIGAKEGLYWVSDPTTNPITLYSFATGAVQYPWFCAPIPGYPAFTSGSVLVYYDANASAYQVVT